MDIIVKFLEVMQVVLLAKVALLIIFGLSLALFGLVKRKFWLVGIGLLVAFMQFLTPLLFNASHESQIAARREVVQAMTKAPIPADYPRRLVIEGDVPDSLAPWFIASGYFDEVVQGGTRLVATTGMQNCKEAVLTIRNRDPSSKRPAFTGNPQEKLNTCVKLAGSVSPAADAIILRTGNRTTLFDKNSARRNGAPKAIQISVRSGGIEKLSHYDEMPALGYQKNAMTLLPPGYEYPCRDFDYFQIVSNLLDSAKHPTQKAGLMKRGEIGRRSKYDTCLTAPAPVREQHEES